MPHKLTEYLYFALPEELKFVLKKYRYQVWCISSDVIILTGTQPNNRLFFEAHFSTIYELEDYVMKNIAT